MGTDRWENHYTCPCGHGVVTETVEEPDHPWIRAGDRSTSYRLDCEICRQTLTIRGECLVPLDLSLALDESRSRYFRISLKNSRLRRERAAEIAKTWEPIPPKSMKAELRLLQEKHGAKGWCYSTYNRTRKKRSFHEILSDYVPMDQTMLAVPETDRMNEAAANLDAKKAEADVHAASMKIDQLPRID